MNSELIAVVEQLCWGNLVILFYQSFFDKERCGECLYPAIRKCYTGYIASYVALKSVLQNCA